tara:strand:- start:62 stop:1321 length:1260 start_codon:yes stop_codon:yes gene_type:complete
MSKQFDNYVLNIRNKTSGEEFFLGGTRIYRNYAAIMWAFGVFISHNKYTVTKDDAIKAFNKYGKVRYKNGKRKNRYQESSGWAQVYRYLTNFGLAEHASSRTEISLTKSGKNLLKKIKSDYLKNYTSNETNQKLNDWNKRDNPLLPNYVRNYYTDYIKNLQFSRISLDTGVEKKFLLKAFYCALNASLHGELYITSPEDRPAQKKFRTNKDMIMVEKSRKKFFDYDNKIKDTKSVGHVGIFLEGLGLVERVPYIKHVDSYELTGEGKKLIQDILINAGNSQSTITLSPIKRKKGFSSLKKKGDFKPGKRNGKGRKATDIVSQAEIYQVTFKVENKNFIYVGQDSDCTGPSPSTYHGSSLIIYHYKEVFGIKIFKKEILETVSNIMQKDLNALERSYINDAAEEAIKKGWIHINYTGKNQ